MNLERRVLEAQPRFQRDRCAASLFARSGSGRIAGSGIRQRGGALDPFRLPDCCALTPRCAAEMGYELSEEDAKRAYVEVSGRKGFGVKADDLITRMQAAAESRVREKQTEMGAADLAKTANASGDWSTEVLSFEVHTQHDYCI